MAKEIKTVFYHGLFAEPVKVWVLKKNTDGTMDVGTEAGAVLVRACPVSDEVKAGVVTLALPKDNGEEPEIDGAINTATE